MLVIRYVNPTGVGSMNYLDDLLDEIQSTQGSRVDSNTFLYPSVGVLNVTCYDRDGAYSHDLYVALTPAGELWLRMNMPATDSYTLFWEAPC